MFSNNNHIKKYKLQKKAKLDLVNFLGSGKKFTKSRQFTLNQVQDSCGLRSHFPTLEATVRIFFGPSVKLHE
jgi:hypothetical protein